MKMEHAVAETNAETHRRFAAEIWNDRNIDSIPEFVADECVVYDPAYPKPIRGPEEYAEYVRDSLTAFPDLHVEQHIVLAEDDYVVTCYTTSGTQEGPFGPLPPTGRSVEIEGMAAIRYADGRIVEDRYFFDTASVRRQLGLSFPHVLLTIPRLAFRAIRDRL